MAENRGEIDPHEMFQNELLLKQTDQTGAFAVDIRDRLARLRESPYFGRIDFKGGDSAAPARIYIGPSAFNYGNEPLIFDWRAPGCPVCSMIMRLARRDMMPPWDGLRVN